MSAHPGRWPRRATLALLLAAVAAAQSQPTSGVDALVLAHLQQHGIEPAPVCSDAVFVRRAYLDVIGTLPTAAEARRFLEDRALGKRTALIDALLVRPEFADYQAMRWADTLRIKSEFPINLWPNAVQAYYRWLHDCLRDNVPYDQFARALLTASGSCFRVAPVNFWRAAQDRTPEGLAAVVALTFLGARTAGWPAERRAGLAALFRQVGYKATQEWKEEIVFHDATKATGGTAAPATWLGFLPDGTRVTLSRDVDPRAVFADWLLGPGAPWLARCAANRVWAWLCGRGIVHEPDDFRDDNPPAVPALLDWLAAELIRTRYDLRQLYRTILTSQTWQRADAPRSPRPEAEALFASYPPRRLEAEVLIDAICQITGTGEEYQSPIPEPFTFLPAGQRAIGLADGSITSPFLELFGRPPRDTGLWSERSNQPTAAQRLHLLNSSHVQRKLESGRGLAGLLSGGNPRRTVTEIYLTILSRFPTPEELETLQARSRPATGAPRQAAEDLAWALLNSTEFLFRH